MVEDQFIYLFIYLLFSHNKDYTSITLYKVVQQKDSVINNPLDKCQGNLLHYPMYSDFSSGYLSTFRATVDRPELYLQTDRKTHVNLYTKFQTKTTNK